MGVHVWDLRNLQTPPIALPMPLSSGRPEFRLLTYSREGNRLAGVQDSIWIWELRNPTAGPSNYGNNNSSPINGMAFSWDGTRVAGATPTGVQVWNLSSMADPSAPSAPLPSDPRMNSVQPTTLGALVYSTDLTRAVDARSGILRLWDLRSATPIAATFEGQLPRLDGVAFCKNDTRVALLSASRFSFWDIGAGVLEPRRLLNLNFSAASPGIACSPDGTRLALTEIVRPADTSTKSVRVIDPTGRIVDSAILPLDPAIVPALSAEGSLVFSPNGNTLAISMGQGVYLWNLQGSETAMQKLTMPSPALPLRMAFSSDGSKFAASSDANTGQTAVWDLRKPHSPPLQLPSSLAMALSHDGSRLATSNGDNLRVWDLRNPTTPSVNLQWRGGRIATLAFTSENRMLKAGDVDGRVAQLPLWSAAAEALCTRVWRNLSKSEWNAHVGEDIPYEKTCPNLPPGVGTPDGPK
jgi:WD40 repeat protein